MSTLTVSNVSDGSLSIPTTYVTNGSAKAWVNFDGTGTIAARDSLNVSSLTDNGTGNYTVNITNSMSNSSYSVPSSCSRHVSVIDAFTSTSFQNRIYQQGQPGALVDDDIICNAVHGDLA